MKVNIKIGDLSFRFVSLEDFGSLPHRSGAVCDIENLSRLTITKCFRFENSGGVEEHRTTFGFGFQTNTCGGWRS